MERRGKKNVPGSGSAKTVFELTTEESLQTYGYLPLGFVLMQRVGSAAQTFGAIRSHWGKATFADPRTIAVAACLDESTVRRRHLPKLLASEFLRIGRKETPNGSRREYHLQGKPEWFNGKFATLPTWAALMLPEWSYRAMYAMVIQRARAGAGGSKGGVGLEFSDFAWGGYGCDRLPLTAIAAKTGLSRRAVFAAKSYLIDEGWLEKGERIKGSDTLRLNAGKEIPADLLVRAHKTTRAMMFHRRKQTAIAVPNRPELPKVGRD